MSPFRVLGVSQEVANMFFQVREVDQRNGCICFGFDSGVNNVMSHHTIVARDSNKCNRNIGL